MTIETTRPDSRNREILRNAIEAFASYGVRGASLRDIARRAGVSLTLIHHHFGSKPDLVWATTHSLHAAGAPHLARFKAALRTPIHSSSDLVEAWMRYLVDAFGSSAQRPHLRLIDRLRADPDVEPDAQASLDATEPIVREALHRLYPDSPASAVDIVLQSARAALVAAMLAGQVPMQGRGEHAGLDEQARRLVEKFVAAAIEAALCDDGRGDPSAEPDPRRSPAADVA